MEVVNYNLAASSYFAQCLQQAEVCRDLKDVSICTFLEQCNYVVVIGTLCLEKRLSARI